MDASEQNRFFDDIVESLRKEGVFQTYDTPKGRPRDDKHSLKRVHEDPRKNILGSIWHVGDEPYWPLTTVDLGRYRNAVPDQADIGFKTSSIRLGIQKYMPDDKFSAYLGHFFDTIGSKSHRHLLLESLENVGDQLASYRPRPTGDEIAQMLADDSVTTNRMREALGDSELALSLEKYPELCLTLGVFHAAHRGYIEQMKAAVARSPNLTDDERDNANFTLNSNSFQQFDSFLLFGTLAPLIIHHYEQTKDEKKVKEGEAKCPFSGGARPDTKIWATAFIERMAAPFRSADHERMGKAISAAWETFFDQNLLQRSYNKEGKSAQQGEDVAMTVTCPAKRHLQESMKGNLIEGIYEQVVQERGTLKPLLDLAQGAVRRQIARAHEDSSIER